MNLDSPVLCFIVHLYVYPFDICFSFNQTDEDVETFLKGQRIDTQDGFWKYDHSICKARTCSFPEGQTLVRMRKIPEVPMEFNWLQHEIFHAVEFIFRKIEMPLTDASCEGYAYLIGYVTECVYEELNKLKR